jgi:hypothetical protein
VQIPPSSSYGGYPPAARDYGYYGQQPPVKRHRTSIDYGRQQGLYDVDGRMARQMDPYGQPTAAAAMYAGQPAAYQTPAAMQTYNTGQVVPDYTAVRTPNPTFRFQELFELTSVDRCTLACKRQQACKHQHPCPRSPILPVKADPASSSRPLWDN